MKPVQIANIDLQDYIDKRKEFTTDEWIDFLIHTVGLDPDRLNRREKFITLARLLPHIENNFNFMELGPKGTGKSHVFQELSPYGVLVSGGDVTSPRLFVRMSGKKEELGLVGYWDVVAWDEFEQQKGRNVEAVLIDTMQNYLANKSFNRGKATHEASASMVFVGNTKHTVPYMLRNSHLFESIPTSFIKGAFLDRIHLYNPGWEIRMLKKDSFTKGYGLISDYLAAVLHALRDRDLTGLLKQYASFDGSLSERDHNAIRKTFSGMVKLLYPDGNMTDEEAYEIIDFATESRKRVKDQLYIIDETFNAEPAIFRYQKPGSEDWVNIETLEKVSNILIQPIDTKDKSDESSQQDETTTDSSQNESGEQQRLRRPRIQSKPQLAQGRRSFRLGQTGVTYKDLFSEYLKDAKEITIEDPYIKVPHQFRNLVDFLGMLIDTRPVDGLKVKVITKEHEDLDKHAGLIDSFDTIKDDMVGYGIEFDYAFRDFHDRFIKTDTGWNISLGSGLDIYEKAENYTLAAARQDRRKCREFSVIYTKE